MSWKLLPDKKPNILSMCQAFTDEEVEVIKKIGESGLNKQASNKFSYSFKPLDPREYDWIYDRVTAVILDSNVNNYEYKLQGIRALYYIEIDDASFMDWSNDLVDSDRETNKLTVHCFLNDDYKEGELHLMDPSLLKLDPKSGLVTLFPSFIPYRQAPTAAGTVKKAIVGTVTGLPFS